MKKLIHSLFKLLSIILIIAAAASAYTWQQYRSIGPLEEPKTLIFAKGSGANEISNILADEGVIPSATIFKAMALATQNYGKFKAGEYAFTPHIKPADVMQMLAQGKTVVHRFTLAEGLNVREVKELLLAETALAGELPSDIPEGSLLPETYFFSRGDLRADIVDRMQKDMRKTLQEAWEKRQNNSLLANPREALILASIVEKETGLKSERPHVASVYLNRIKAGMKLQADPTTAYAIEQMEGPLKRPLTLADLKKELPYNTYYITGLPPGPICNPGKASIEAVLNPDTTQDLYFVATGTGGHWFAKTMEEHAANVARFRQALKAQKNN